MKLIQYIRFLFKKHKSGYSLRGFWGEIKYYNKDNVQIGYSIKGFWGGRKRYDMNGNLISYTLKSFWGGYNTYDANGNLIRRSRKNFWGGYNTYDRNGKKTHESYRSFWGGMNHFDVENPDPYETVTKGKKTVTTKSSAGTTQTVSSRKPSTNHSLDNNSKPASARPYVASVPSRPVATVKEEKPVASKIAERTFPTVEVVKQAETVKKVREDEHEGVEVVSYAKDASVKGRVASDESGYYQSVEEFVKEKEIEQYVKLLVFRYKLMKEFPAIAYLKGNMVGVEPLMVGAEAFEFSLSEVEKAREEHVTDVEMSALDDEFLSCCRSCLGKQFEDLLPDYMFGSNGVYRSQYVFGCGMVITKKSMEELRKLCKE